MDLDADACYRAIQTRDPRFDGRLFVAVRTTGIYCRPICPARTPKRENVAFYFRAAAAQAAGFRPCLRCRPETSPDLGAWRGALPGVGEWTAHYIAMRQLREPDAFPAADIGLMRAMADAGGVRPSAQALLARAESWRPWRAYAAQHLWAADLTSPRPIKEKTHANRKAA